MHNFDLNLSHKFYGDDNGTLWIKTENEHQTTNYKL